MKQFAYLYFNIYNHCSQRSSMPDDGLVRYQAMYLFSLSAGGWILFFQAVYLRLVKMAWFSSPAHAMIFAVSVYFLTALLLHRIFIVNALDQKILSKYGKSWYNIRAKQADRFVSIIIYIAPYLLLLSLSLVFPRQW